MATRNGTTDDVAHTARTVTDEAATAAEQTARAGADTARRGAETARDTLQTGLNTTTEAFQRINDQFTRVLGFSGPQAGKVARHSSENIQAVSQASTVLVRGTQEVSQELLGMTRDQLAKNLEAFNRLLGCRSVQEFVTVQSDLARDSLQQVIDTNRRVAEVSLRIADEAAQVMQGQVDTSPKQARRAA